MCASAREREAGRHLRAAGAAAPERAGKVALARASQRCRRRPLTEKGPRALRPPWAMAALEIAVLPLDVQGEGRGLVIPLPRDPESLFSRYIPWEVGGRCFPFSKGCRAGYQDSGVLFLDPRERLI